MSQSTIVEASTFVYVGNSDSQDVTVLELLSSGELRPIASVAVPGPSKPGGSLPIAVAPDKKFLYVGLRNEPYSVASFSINGKTGILTYIGSVPLADSMAYISTDRTGRFLLSASYGGNKVTVNPIGSNGLVGAVQQTVTDVPKAHCIITDATNQFVLYTSLGGDRIHQQKFDAKTGMLSPNDPPARHVKVSAGPRHLVFSPDEKFVFLLNELDATVHVFPYDASRGTLKEAIQTVPLLPEELTGKPWAADIHLTPDGKFLFASERGSSTLTAFRVATESGRLTRIASYATAKQPRAFRIDPSGRFLLAVGQLSNSLIIYSIDRSTGTLSEIKTYPVGKNPNWVEIVSFPQVSGS
ncbi:MAG: beta-propeller fold lactonase family protein [Armatimonadota bacterium]